MSVEDVERSRERDRSARDRTRFNDQSRDRSPDRGKARGANKSSPCRVYVSNIPYEYRWQDMKDLFRKEVGDVSFVELFVDESDKPRGCGIVEFSDNASVKKCLEVMHRFELKGRKLVIKEDYGNQRDKFGNLVGSAASKRARDREDGKVSFRDERRPTGGFDAPNQMNSNQDFSDRSNTYGLSPSFLDSLGINLPLISRVFVANLDYKVDKKKLKEVFRLAGKVQRIDLSADKDGKSRGFAVLEYDHPVEAVQAISMFHNQVLYDRIMTVRMDREGDKGIVKLPDGLKDIGMGLGSNGEPLRDVARNLPSVNNQPPQPSGAGILGAVPSVPLGIGNLGNLSTVGSSALNNLSTNAAVLQAANLAGVGGLSSNLLANSLGGGDLGLAASLVNNPLVQNQSLAALTGTGNLGGGSSLNSSSFSRNDLGSSQNNSSFQSSVLSQNKNYLGGGNRSFDDKSSNFDFGNADRDSRNKPNQNAYGGVNNGNQMLRGGRVTDMNAGGGGGGVGGGGENGYSNKILISNLPPTASYKMITEKCSEFGEVQRFEDKGNNGLLVVFGSQWEAERAIKNMDRARINGRTIDVRFFY
ncbi:myelin expression factor 2 isoform X2 [Photinus pyralis]|nr:myelin expression factor 2 isoform X2 [Photinus pyralis]